MTTSRTVIRAGGQLHRMVLKQPPGYRKGADLRPTTDRAAAGAAIALSNARNDRAINSKSNGTRPRAY